MKLKLATLLFLVGLILSAQKELQPYNFSITKNGKTESILIYASAEAVNSITFTLKNTENETLKREKENEEGVEDITFKVFPFTEVIFRKKLIENIFKIIEKDTCKPEFSRLKAKIKPLDKKGESENNLKNKEKTKKDSIIEELKKENETYKTRKEAVYIIRNVYQFFNALVITAFEYDTEPVAGLLKYELNDIIITKKTIQGLNTDFYFKKQAKFIRKYIFDSKEPDISKEIIKLEKGNYYIKDSLKTEYIKIGKDNYIYKKDSIEDFIKIKNDNYIKIKDISRFFIEIGENKYLDFSDYAKNETDDFLKYIREHNEGKIIREFYEFNQNSSKGFLNNARTAFKQYAIQKLKVHYNNYMFNELKTKVIDNYTDLIKGKSELLESIRRKALDAEKITDTINLLKKSKNRLNETIKNIQRVDLKKIQKDIDDLTRMEQSTYKEWSRMMTDSTNIDSQRIINAMEKYDSIKKQVRDKLKEKENERNKTKKSEELSILETKIDTLEVILAKKRKRLDTIKKDLTNFKENLVKNRFSTNNLIIDNKDNIKQFPLWVITADKLEIDINDGFLEHVMVLGSIKKPFYNDKINKEIKQFFKDTTVQGVLTDMFGKELKFDNDFPFGFSSKSDFADLYNYHLYQSEGQEKLFSLPVTNLISYIQRHQNDRLDFSPKDQMVRLPLDDPNLKGEIELKKEISSKILSVNIFTDFNGFQENAENGLLQMEVDKKIPIWTKRMNLRLGRSSNFGFVNYANFNLSWQKIGEEDKELVLAKSNRFENNQQVTDFYTTYLDLVKHENISVGVDLNIATFDFPLAKTRLELNAGAHYGRIKVVDEKTGTLPDGATSTTRDFEETVNMIRLYPDIMLWIRPEERFGGYLRYRPFRTIVPNNEKFFSVSSGKDFEEKQELSKDWLNRFEFSAFFTPSSDSDNKFFFRYRYTNNSTWETNGYSEVQVGYLAYLKF